MGKKSNKIVKNKASRGQDGDIEVAEPVAAQSTEELEHRNKSEANFYCDYVARQNGSQNQENCAEGEKMYCCSFHAKLLQQRSKEPSAPYPLTSNPIWMRVMGPMPPTISTPGFDINVKIRDKKKSGGAVEVPEIFDTYAYGEELKRRGFISKIQLPDFRKMMPRGYHGATMDIDSPMPDA
ncbi:uncharacterized protein LOC117588525 isoform X2 [Drosophila guanche]|uniref:Uncharacterized protein n=1 Tax=Drosophila guanche TaxID=7266 RepID=A0A3B0KK61_DROGU|nr:uncharacterized protein LOC117588525 isoform X2 [Drosophila guanche]SPP86899.1 Hypothetical predicted protein [Drosophila guanche]